MLPSEDAFTKTKHKSLETSIRRRTPVSAGFLVCIHGSGMPGRVMSGQLVDEVKIGGGDGVMTGRLGE